MNLFYINISASIMIIITLLLRKTLKHRIPHFVFVLLWLSIGIKLLFLISIDAPSSIFNLRYAKPFESKMAEELVTSGGIINTTEAIANSTQLSIKSGFFILQYIWFFGFLLMAGYFIVQYYYMLKKRNYYSPYFDEKVEKTIKYQRLIIPVSVVQSNDITSPATCGILNPVIILPLNFDLNDDEYKTYMILHECGHIKYFHSFFKLVSMLILSLYWYNPCVWLLFLCLEKDMEISSDRYVLTKLDAHHKESYARSLIKSASALKTPLFYHNYKKEFVKERIEAIMGFKRLTVGAVIVALLVSASVVSVFATSDVVLTDNDLRGMNVEVIAMIDDNTPIAEPIYLELEWQEIEEYAESGYEKAAQYYNITNYKYTTYGKIPPNEIYVTVDKSGKKYSGTITRGNYIYDAKNDKYTGYYSGKVYLQ